MSIILIDTARAILCVVVLILCIYKRYMPGDEFLFLVSAKIDKTVLTRQIIIVLLAGH